MFGIQEATIKTYCHTHGCYNEAPYFFGNPDSPNGTVYYVCAKCTAELKAQVATELQPEAPAKKKAAKKEEVAE